MHKTSTFELFTAITPVDSVRVIGFKRTVLDVTFDLDSIFMCWLGTNEQTVCEDVTKNVPHIHLIKLFLYTRFDINLPKITFLLLTSLQK